MWWPSRIPAVSLNSVVSKLPKGTWSMTPTDNERRKKVVVNGYGKVIAKGLNPFKESVIIDAGSVVVFQNKIKTHCSRCTTTTTITITIIICIVLCRCECDLGEDNGRVLPGFDKGPLLAVWLLEQLQRRIP